MSTIDSKELIDLIIARNGFYEDDPRVALIVEYTNAYGNRTWGVTWSNEHISRQERYLLESAFVNKPKVIWRASENPIHS